MDKGVRGEKRAKIFDRKNGYIWRKDRLNIVEKAAPSRQLKMQININAKTKK